MPSKAVFDVARIRAAARARAEVTSRRATAAEIGMSLTGFLAFLRGGKPHARTRQKLVEWYVAHPRDGAAAPAITYHDIDAAIRLLTRYVNGDGRPSVRAQRAGEVAKKVAEAIRTD